VFQLSMSNLFKMDTFIFHRSTYIPSMTHLIPLTMLTMKGHSGNSEQTGSEQELPKMSGLWPNRFCGMAFLDLSVDQGVWQSKHFLDHVFATDSVSNLILTVL
jgi:hypothetical protein